ncbi:hypothetical protein [Thiomonas bhubaneswarensis]|uniref:Uncharacterized protein n=1 Tax=Thiomonas bhubaneswarensis TaxID=339866 RepID=A0A0K6I2V0_9BURK|nr:hypothetical protein [Thiomonas bhubaneswarensis]CUA97484.1 hypothetical protein Ga0061069_105278 [Thiomonas bhubaneswarensis]
MGSSEALALAAHLHVLLRRKIGRVTDTEWMAQNADYAKEVLRVARAENDADLNQWADRFEAVMFPGGIDKGAGEGGKDKGASAKPAAPASYLGRLR